MRKLMAITMAIMFVLSTAMPASAFVSDVKQILQGEADLATGIADLKTMPVPKLRDASTNAIVAGTKLTWTYSSTKTWKTANQYLEVSYQANLPGWGIQIYTDNMAADASPKWVEKPVDSGNLRADKPAGLVGNGTVNYLAVPVAWKAFPYQTTTGGAVIYPTYAASLPAQAVGESNADYAKRISTWLKTNYTDPTEKGIGDPAAANYYVELYQHLYNDGTKDNYYGKLCWLIDKGSQKWTDANSNGQVDSGEIVTAYANAADYNTVVNYLGSSSSTYDASGSFIFRDTTISPIYVTLAAKIAAGTIKAKYSTSKLTLELYHE